MTLAQRFRGLVARHLTRLRERAGLTMRRLAAESGVSLGCITMIECARRTPNLFTAYRLCAALDVPLEALFDLRARYDQDAGAPVVVMPGE